MSNLKTRAGDGWVICEALAWEMMGSKLLTISRNCGVVASYLEFAEATAGVLEDGGEFWSCRGLWRLRRKIRLICRSEFALKV